MGSLSKEIYLIKKSPFFILYAPLKGIISEVTKEEMTAIEKLKKSNSKRGINKKTLESIEKLGLFAADTYPEYWPELGKPNFKPASATLLPTTDCSLRCIYCYALTGETPKRYMPWITAKAVIDFVMKNAKERGFTKTKIGFSGDGEPTFNWNIITKSVNYAKEKGKEMGLEPLFGITTNGILTNEKIKFLADNFESIQVSFDILKGIHNKNRPYPDGSGSYDDVFKTIKKFKEIGKNIMVRSTISGDQISKMPEMVIFAAERIKPSSLQIEPAIAYGRCAQNELDTINKKYIKMLQKCEEIAEKHNLKLVSTNARMGMITAVYCNATGRQIFVTSEGIISTCPEIRDCDDPWKLPFTIGKVVDGKIKFDEKKRKYLFGRTADKVPLCKNCFAKWHCCGNCLSKCYTINKNIFKPPEDECDIIREATKNQLIKALNDKSYVSAGKITIHDLNDYKRNHK